MTKKRTPDQRQKDDVRVLIEEAKIRNKLTESALSTVMGISTTTLTERKRDPGGMTIDKLLVLLELTGKEFRFHERLQ